LKKGKWGTLSGNALLWQRNLIKAIKSKHSGNLLSIFRAYGIPAGIMNIIQLSG